MNRSEEDLAKLLAEHAVATVSYTGHEVDGICCASPQCAEGGFAIEFPDMDAFAAHQAEVIAAAGWLRGELDYRVWIERDPHQSGGLDLEEASGSGYWFPIKNLNVAKHREKHPEARIEKRFIGATDWEEA